MIFKKAPSYIIFSLLFYISSISVCSNEQANIISQKSHPTTCVYISKILEQHPDKVKNIVFLLGKNAELHAYDTTLLIPISWVDALEIHDPQIENIIQTYINTQMISRNSFIHKVDWNKVGMGIILSCLVLISLHLYKIEKVMKRIDNQIKSNTIFWLCTLPNKVYKSITVNDMP